MILSLQILKKKIGENKLRKVKQATLGIKVVNSDFGDLLYKIGKNKLRKVKLADNDKLLDWPTGIPPLFPS